MKLPRSLTGLCAAAALSLSARAAVPIALTGGTFQYTQNFDAMFMPTGGGNVTSPVPWADNSTIPNWWFVYAANGTGAVLGGASFAHFGSDGASTTQLTLNSSGSANSPDRAFCTPTTTTRGEQSGIVIFQNPGTTAVDLTSIRYNAEVYRTNQNTGSVESIFPWYRIAATQAALLTFTTAPANATVFPPAVSSSPNSHHLSGWTQIPSARWTYVSPASAQARRETFAINSDNTGGISGTRVGPGEFIAIRFSNVNDDGVDGLYGIDDLQITFVDAPVAMTPVVTNVVRNENSTLTDPGDDTISFTLTVNGSAATGPEWVLPGISSGVYGTAVTITRPISEFASGAHTRGFTIQDDNNAALTASFTITAPWCSITPVMSNFRMNGSQLEFQIGVTAQYGGPTYLQSGIASPIPYGSPTAVTSTPGSQLFTTFTDTLDPSCTASLTAILPAVIGANRTILPQRPLLSLPVLNTTNLWVFDNAAATFTLNAAPSQTDHQVLSETVDLTATGPVDVVVELQAITGASSGFEGSDRFRCDLIIDGGAPVSILGTYDANSDGQLTGATNSSGGELPGEFVTNATVNYTFSTTLPAEANSVQLRIIGNSNSGNETYVVRNISIATEVRVFRTGNTAMSLRPGTTGKLTADSLLQLAVNATGPVSLTAVQATTPSGASIAQEGPWIIYQPAPGFTGVENFTFTLTDGATSVSGHVTVVVDAGAGRTFNIVGLTPDGAGQRVTALGIPGRSYAWEYSDDLTTWILLAAPAPCPPSGVLILTDPGPLPPSRFYRAAQR